ncbi:MAG: hypothetical protein GX663_02900 [Clostridiales bacterium]|nr:hypothetical protein [Clostridiales bacterium]
MTNSKRGNSAVFLTMILAALMAITLTLIYGVREESVKSRVDGIVNLAGDSVMSEFNYEVQKEYGLFLLKGKDEILQRKLRNYINYSLKYMGETALESVSVSGGRFSVSNTEPVKEQILEYMKFAKLKDVLVKLYDVDEKTEEEGTNSMENRTLRNGAVIVSLPSADVPKKNFTVFAKAIADEGDGVKAAFSKASEKYLIDSYVFGHFNSRTRAINREHFFKNEVEYALGGEMSDRKNEKRIEMILKAMRFPPNLAHIYADPEKRSATLAAAELLTPGPAALATQAALASTWAYAEADNDVELLWQGSKVPIIKSKETWAIDLDSAMEGILGSTAKPDIEKGYTYQQYLRIMLYFQDENMKVARIMDLVQINMRKQYDGTFLIQEHWTGVSIDVKVNGEKFSYEKKY